MKKPKFNWILWVNLPYLIFWTIVTAITDEWFVFHLCGLVVAFFTGAEVMEHRIKQKEHEKEKK